MTKEEFDPKTQQNIEYWLNGNFDLETKESIKKLVNENPKEAIDSFYTHLSFGTGGLRGIMGLGTNRMNIHVVGSTTQGFANYLLKQSKPVSGYSVIIGYDTRHNSRAFAEESARVLAGNGIKVYLFRDIRPTPLVSFGCRLKKCSGAIMITASHNPSEYNGYKVYWNDGAQVLPPHDQGIIEEVIKATNTDSIKRSSDLINPLIELIDAEIDIQYLVESKKLALYSAQNKNQGHKLKIVYTSLHGTGITMVPPILEEWGFKNLHLVDSQIIPDGNFPTVECPNPEENGALQLGKDLLQNIQGDILIATDPDADRVGVAVIHKGKTINLTGNQIACLCVDHICQALGQQNKMPKDAAFIKTIATSELFKAIVTSYKKPCFDVLTGFKYIAELINHWDNRPIKYDFIFGGEESHGYLFGTLARDKDAIISSALICEMALQAKLSGKTLIDNLYDLYERFGVYTEKLLNITYTESKEDKEKLGSGITRLQKNPPKSFNGLEVLVLQDYRRGLSIDLKTDRESPLELPKTNCLTFWLSDGTKLMVRPSGTEPKIKIYCGVVKKTTDSIENVIKQCEQHADHLMESLRAYIQQ